MARCRTFFLAIAAALALQSAQAGEPATRHSTSDADTVEAQGLRGMQGERPLEITLGRQPRADDGDRSGLRGAISSAIDASPKLRAAEMDAKAAATGVLKQASSYLPTVTLGVTGNRGTIVSGSAPALGAQLRRSAALNLNLNLFNGGQTFYATRSAQSAASAANAEIRATQADVALEVAAAYLQYLLAERTIATLGHNVARIEKLRVSVRQRLAAGFASVSDQEQVEAELASLQQQVAEARTITQKMRSDVESLAGRKVRFVAHLPRLDKHLGVGLEALAQETAASNPRIASARHQATAADYTSRASFGRLLPQVDFTARAERAYDHLPGVRPNGWQVGLQLTAPLLDAGSAFEYRQRREAALAVQLRADETHRQITAQTRSLWQEYRGSAARLAAANRRANALKKVTFSQEKLFDAGLIPLDTLLDKHRLWSTAEIQRDQIAMQRYVVMCQLLASVGRFELAMLGH